MKSFNHLYLAGLLLVLIHTNQALAQHSCLSQASNSALIEELSRRLSGGGGGQTGNVTVAATCTSSNLIVTAWNSSTSRLNRIETYLYSETNCQKYADIIDNKVSRLTAGGVIGFCASSSLITIYISNTGDLTKTDTYVYSDSKCESEARRINL